MIPLVKVWFLILADEPRLSISPSQLVFRVGDQLTVTADARPAVHRLACIASIPGEADYDIENTYDVANKQIVGATISITDEMSGQKTVVQCTAVNSIDGRERTSCKNVTIIVEAAVRKYPKCPWTRSSNDVTSVNEVEFQINSVLMV